MKIQPNNWGELQHYKDRSPIWIKLHRKLLDNYEFHCLPVASRALAPMLWLLSSEYHEGIIEGSEIKIAFRLRMSAEEFVEALTPLISFGFFTMYQDASTPLAEPEHVAILEKRREEKETEKTVAPSRTDSPPKNEKLQVDFDYQTGQFANISPVMINLWEQGYPAIDVEREIHKAAAWAMANPKNKKSNWPRFLTNWLSKAQEKAPRTGANNRKGGILDADFETRFLDRD